VEAIGGVAPSAGRRRGSGGRPVALGACGVACPWRRPRTVAGARLTSVGGGGRSRSSGADPPVARL